ncbi:putative pectinesterase/pectinesterase inhibitor 24 [Cucumis melo var. makuwa]|uniref:Pectinesterase n=1 Tax=Cucumis melo var. makuwa TaxID=1194695 RepID=A0A5D3C2L2_CUCMM|nr:putative pectinesterase/pectinesterase inhibitor 24 [Cucumis melo var. makuwa]
MSFLRPYGKVDETDQLRLDASRRTRRRIVVIVLSSVVLVAVVVAVVFGTRNASNNNDDSNNQNGSLSASIKAVCDVTLYPDTCQKAFGPFANSSHLDPGQISKLAVQLALGELSKVADHIFDHAITNTTDDKTILALKNCHELLDLALDHLNITLSSSDITLLKAVDDLKTWLTSAATYQQTCIDGLAEVDPALADLFANFLKNSTELTSNGLAIVSFFSKLTDSLSLRRLMSYEDRQSNGDWARPILRKLAQSDIRKQADIVVAKDSSGKYKTITEALKAVPDKSKKRTVIYVKKGTYKEKVEVVKNKWNVVMVGDGMNATIVSGSLNVIDGTPTFSTASFAAKGKGFIAIDMGFINTAGPSKHQAVALMSTSDQSIFYRCQMNAYQDTLYAHSNRQFYRECKVYGTVDFIFGNSAVVLQNCTIAPRLPLLGQNNTITAQGRFDPNQNTGISIQGSLIQPFDNLKTTETYLGRPWKNYSTTVFMQSNLGSLIHPSGWLPWVGTSAPDTIFYAEFQNYGRGSSTSKRVKWKGVKNIDIKTAKKFTVSSFIDGKDWISKAQVPFTATL